MRKESGLDVTVDEDVKGSSLGFKGRHSGLHQRAF